MKPKLPQVITTNEAKEIIRDVRDSLLLMSDDPQENEMVRVRKMLLDATDSLAGFDFSKTYAQFETTDLLLARQLRVGVSEEARYLEVIQRIALGGRGGSEAAAIRMAEFIKSQEGYDFMHKADKSWEDLPLQTQEKAVETLAVYLGGINKAELIEDCVRAVRAERVGTVLAYFLSGRLENNLLDHANLPTSGENRRPDLVEYLREKIKASDFSTNISLVDTIDGKKTRATAEIMIDDHSGKDQNSIRLARNVDHFVLVDHENGIKKVVFGNSFSGPPDFQIRSFVKYYRTIEAATKQELDFHGNPNPLFGAILDPFYLHTGNFSQDDSSGEGVAIGNLLRTAVDSGQIETEDLRAVGTLSLLGVGAHSESPRDLSVFFRHNMFVGGTDTFHLYDFVHGLNEEGEGDNSPERQARIIGFMANEIKMAANGLAYVVGQNFTTTFSKRSLQIIERFVINLDTKFSSMVDQDTWDTDIEPMLLRLENLGADIISNGARNAAEKGTWQGISNICKRLRQDGFEVFNARAKDAVSSGLYEEDEVTLESVKFGSSIKAAIEALRLKTIQDDADTAAKILLPRLVYQLIARRENTDLPNLSGKEKMRILDAKKAFSKFHGTAGTPMVSAIIDLAELHASTKQHKTADKTRTVEVQAREIMEKYGLNPEDYGSETVRKVRVEKTLSGKMRISRVKV